MLPIRQRAVCMARRAQAQAQVRAAPLAAVRFASTESHDDHGHEEPVDESFGAAWFMGLGVIPFSYILYKLSRPGPDGEATKLEAYLSKFSYLTSQWETRNTLHTAAVEQAAHDKNLLYTVDRNTHVELRYPESFSSSSPYNVPAGHNVKLDKVVEHYREQYHKEVERQSKAAAAAAAPAEE